TVTGAATFGGEVGVGTELTSITVADGATIDTDAIETTGEQDYKGAVTLGSDTTLSASTVDFESTLDGGYTLGVTGDATFGGIVGTTALASLTVDGTTAIDTTAITTTGEQDYKGD